MKTKWIIALALALLTACQSKPKQKEQEWIQLFNGKDLEGWTMKITHHPMGENFNQTFRVENGLLLTRYDQYDEFQGEMATFFTRPPFPITSSGSNTGWWANRSQADRAGLLKTAGLCSMPSRPKAWDSTRTSRSAWRPSFWVARVKGNVRPEICVLREPMSI